MRLPMPCRVWLAGKSNGGAVGCCAAGLVEQCLGVAGFCCQLPALCFPLGAPGAGKCWEEPRCAALVAAGAALLVLFSQGGLGTES